jgi:hypothetical protein
MRAHSGGAVGERATKRKVHTRSYVVRAPVGLAILSDYGQSILQPAAFIWCPEPRLSLVEMRVQVGADWPDHSAVEVDRRQAVICDGGGPRADGDLVNFAARNCQRTKCKRV